MDKLLIKLSELTAIVCLAAFILFVSAQNETSKTSPEEMSKQLFTQERINSLIERDKLYLEKQYAIDSESLEYIICYNSDSVMDVTEYMLIKCEKQQAQTITDAIEKALDEKEQLFDNYAPRQSALLNSKILIYEKGYLLLAIGNDAQAVHSLFRALL